MEELKQMLIELAFNYYEHGNKLHTIIPESDINPILEYVKNNFVPLGAEVIVKTAEEIIEWHKEKFPTADKWDVYCKLLEEVGELGKAIAKQTDIEVELEFGDVDICLIVLAHKLNLSREKAVEFSHEKNLAKEPI